MRFPTIKQVAADLAEAKKDMQPGNDMDVRLQVMDDCWAVHYGDPQYDQDHRGCWGYGTLRRGTNCRDLARDLIEEAKEHHFLVPDAPASTDFMRLW